MAQHRFSENFVVKCMGLGFGGQPNFGLTLVQHWPPIDTMWESVVGPTSFLSVGPRVAHRWQDFMMAQHWPNSAKSVESATLCYWG